MMRRLTRILLLILLMMVLSACGETPNFLNSASPVAEEEARLFWITLIMSIPILLIVWGLLIFNILRYRSKATQEVVPEQIYREKLVEIIYTGVPLLMVLALFGLTLRSINALNDTDTDEEPVRIRVVGYRWWWAFEYPDYGFVTADEMQLPVDRPIELDIESADVNHSFWVPQLAGKMDAIPGVVNELNFTATRIGTFHGHCAEFCGLNHATMRVRAVVQTQEAFDMWVAQQQQAPPEPRSDLEMQGHSLVTSPLCMQCHSLGAESATELLGPDLNHLFSRDVFAGATFDLTEENLRAWLEDPQAMKPGNLMPDLNLPDQTIDALMAYLETLE